MTVLGGQSWISLWFHCGFLPRPFVEKYEDLQRSMTTVNSYTLKPRVKIQKPRSTNKVFLVTGTTSSPFVSLFKGRRDFRGRTPPRRRQRYPDVVEWRVLATRTQITCTMYRTHQWKETLGTVHGIVYRPNVNPYFGSCHDRASEIKNSEWIHYS